jgi:hypothetical protein
MVGDSLVYAVIPAAAASYGLGAVGVSLVLSVNRFVRLALNPLAARWLGRVGLRRGTVVGSALALASTVGYAVAPGLAVLLAARLVWGAAFATLRLTMLGYATVDRDRSPRRVGLSVGVQELAPAVLLVLGASLLGVLGPRWLFASLAGITLLALPLALALPGDRTRGREGEAGPEPASAGAPPTGSVSPAPGGDARPRVRGLRRASLAAVTVAFGVDGALTAGVVLTLLAYGAAAAEAAALGGVVLATRKVAQVLVSPLAGTLAQRWGVTSSVTVGMIATAAGLGLVAVGSVLTGSLLAVVAAAAVAALTPAALDGPGAGAHLGGLGWLTTARDFGAATGAAFAPLALVGAAAGDVVAWTFGLTAAAVLASAVVWLVASSRG